MRAPLPANVPAEQPLDYEFGLEAAGGVTEQFLVLARLFLKHTPDLMSRLDLATGSRHAAEIARQAHSLQGSAAAIGARPLSSVAGSLNQGARAQLAWDEIVVLRDAVHSAWAELAAVLGKIVQTQTRA